MYCAHVSIRYKKKKKEEKTSVWWDVLTFDILKDVFHSLYLIQKITSPDVRWHKYPYNHACYSRLKLICFLPAAKIWVFHIRGFSSIFSDQTTNAKRRRYLVSRVRTNKVVWDVASILKADAIYIPLVLYSTKFSSFFPPPPPLLSCVSQIFLSFVYYPVFNTFVRNMSYILYCQKIF